MSLNKISMNIEDEIKKAVYFQKTGELGKARVIYEKILELNPGHSECTSLLNLISIQEYKKGKALDFIASSSQDTYKTPSYYNNLGVSFYKKGELDKAIFCYKKALEENPKNANALNNIGLIYRDQGNPHDAILCYKKAIEIDKGFSNAYNNMGLALNDQGKLDAAILCYKKALEEDPKNANALHNIGSVYRKQGNTHEATLCYRNALEIEPDNMKALYNLGGILEEGGKLDEAEACYRRLLKIIPDYAQGKQNLGIILLLKGELREGFELYESRWKANNLKPRFSGTRWEGQALKSKTILLYAEQGIGDTIQFVRYAPIVKDLGCKVIVAVQPTLTGVLSNIEGIDQVISYDTNTPFYDYHTTLLSLPHIFKTTLDTIPNIAPYLSADNNSINKWKSIFNNPLDFKVGLVWAGSPKNGNDKRRSFSVETLIPLLHIRGIKFFSLQMGEKSKELNLFGLNTEITDLSPELKDARDTAAAITLMDLIISVDTSVGHLSGALAHPTWLLLPFAPDWRWMLKREDTPWYPTMRLFRQPEPGDWGTVVEKIKRELTQIVKKRQQFSGTRDQV